LLKAYNSSSFRIEKEGCFCYRLRVLVPANDPQRRLFLTQLRAILESLRHADSSSASHHSYGGLTDLEKKVLVDKGCLVYQGKVRELVRRGKELDIYHTDRLSAFDRHVGMVPYKGLILAQTSSFWFKKVQGSVPNHYLASPHERVLRVESLDPIRAEIVVRGYLAGSMMRAYLKGERSFCGVTLPEGLEPFGALPELIITPTTKAAAYEHDENASPKELIARGIVTREEWECLTAMALALFRSGSQILAEKGWMLADTKYEFGRDAAGHLKIIDEIHTPDSSRLWVRKSYESRCAAGQEPEMFDKENVRRYLLAQGFSGHGTVPEVPAPLLIDLALTYLDVAEGLMGHPLETSSEAPQAEQISRTR
jgi:phosphoribosylaminoimidazole-succinocarboxamide synthase